jgi:enoyl-CoA hydratase
MTTNPVNAQNQAFFADLHDAFGRLEREHPDSPVVLTGTGHRPLESGLGPSSIAR